MSKKRTLSNALRQTLFKNILLSTSFKFTVRTKILIPLSSRDRVLERIFSTDSTSQHYESAKNNQAHNIKKKIKFPLPTRIRTIGWQTLVKCVIVFNSYSLVDFILVYKVVCKIKSKIVYSILVVVVVTSSLVMSLIIFIIYKKYYLCI